MPKRPPNGQVYDSENEVHRDFISAYSCLLANMYGVQIPYEAPRSIEAKKEMAKSALEVTVKEFIPNEEKSKEIESQVDKQNKGEND